MKRTVYKWLVASSVLVGMIGGAAATGETRPKYGGTLRVASGAALTSLDPADGSQADSFSRNSITALLFDTLVKLDASGRAQPWLATSWDGTADGKRWTLHLRRGVVFHDGSGMTADAVASSLRMANASWNVLAGPDDVTIQSEKPVPNLPAMLALPGNAIVKRGSSPGVSGSGPFRVADWQPGKKLTLAAFEDCWRGRPYLDAIEIELGRPAGDRLAALEAGRSDLIDVPVEISRRVALGGNSASTSLSAELIVMVFAKDAQTSDELTLRNALALSLDRASLHNVVMQGAGDAQGGILPDWMTGYGALFASQADLVRARTLRRQAQAASVWSLKYDGGDALLRLLAERIALNAKDADLVVKPVTEGTADARLVRIVLPTTDAWVDLAAVANVAGLPPIPNLPDAGGGPEQLYAAEVRMLAGRRVVPLLHLPAEYAASRKLRGFSAGACGNWQVSDAWLEPATP